MVQAWLSTSTRNPNMDSEVGDGASLSTGAVGAIVCNTLVAVLIIILILVLCKACKVPSSQERAPVLSQNQEKNAPKYVLTP